MDLLVVSVSERVLLEALVVSPDLPAIQSRAGVVLRAADGIEDVQIATELFMRRKDVLHWRKRFQEQGVRGLWDVPGAGPKQRVSPEKERAVVWDVLYGASGMGWKAKLLAQRHALSRPAVYRIFEKYGIVRGEHGLVEMEPLKIFLDPLFGVTVSGIAGLYYGTCGVLALSSAVRPFSELDLVANTTSLSQAATVLLDELHKLAELRYAKFMDIAALKVLEGNAFLGWLNRIEDRRESNAEIHLLADLPQWEPQALPSFQEWLTHHTNFKMHYAPIVKHLFWFHLVQRVFSIVAALPVQAQLVADVNGLAKG